VSLEAAVPDGPVEVDCAEDLAAQVLANLVHLAVRRGTRGNHVAVVLERTDAGFRVEVVDDAPGAPPGRIPTLDDSRRHSGSRLPAEVFTLAVCRHACGVLGWTLALEASTPAGVRAAVVGPVSDPT
jgi:two-component system sensor histidine kinase TctE